MSANGDSKKLGIRGRAARKARVIEKELFLEKNHDPSRAVLMLGSGRSGTTWLGEMLARQTGSRLLFEPYHPQNTPLAPPLPLFLDPEDRNPALISAAGRVLAGRVRNRQVDQVRTARLPRGRIVKDIHASNLLPWFRATFPAVPVVYIVRHPIAASLSRLRAPYFYGLSKYVEVSRNRRLAERSPVAAWLPVFDEYSRHSEPLVRQVAEWCLENAYPLSLLGDEESLAFYELTVLHPDAELARLGKLCASAIGEPVIQLGIEEMRKPSAKDWFGTAAGAQGAADWDRIVGRWREKVTPAEIDQCLEVLAAFGLGDLYGEGPIPLAASRLVG